MSPESPKQMLWSGRRVSVGQPWEIRRVPMIPDMRRLLEQLRSERSEEDWLSTPVVRVRECQKAIDAACKQEHSGKGLRIAELEGQRRKLPVLVCEFEPVI